MNPWDSLLDEQALAAVMPAAYRDFAGPVKGALAVFLGGLDEARQQEVLALQAALDADATVSERLGALAQSCPVLQKLGQILARDPRIAPELRQQLQQLESLPPTVTVDEIRATLIREFGRVDAAQFELAAAPLAEASVAVVIPFTLRGAAGANGRISSGVLKVLKPRIEEQLAAELALLGDVGDYLDRRCAELGLIEIDYAESFRRVRQKLAGEVRLDQEQAHLAAAQREFADEPRVQIPALLDFCSPRITAMERVYGVKITDRLPADLRGRQRLASLVAEALIARPVLAPEPRAVFHSDPHAGNLFLTNDGRLAILDWSLVGELTEAERASIVQIVLGAAALDEELILDHLGKIADAEGFDRPAVAIVVRKWLQRIVAGDVPGLNWVVGLLDEAVQTARLRVHGELMLFRKSLYTVQGVVESIAGGTMDVDDVLVRGFARALARELPRRWFASPVSREFATRTSNLDLLALYLRMPALAALQSAALARRLLDRWTESIAAK